jgi:hypothetical protein
MPVARSCSNPAGLLQIIDSNSRKSESGASQTGTKSDIARCAAGPEQGQTLLTTLMTMLASRKTVRVTEPEAFGDVTLAPALLTGQSETQLARAMAHALVEKQPSSASQALGQLRALFPESPLTVRVAALNALMRR